MPPVGDLLFYLDPGVFTVFLSVLLLPVGDVFLAIDVSESLTIEDGLPTPFVGLHISTARFLCFTSSSIGGRPRTRLRAASTV
mmetsp:Transcript_3112/g.4076  ORF Transcript_3112/g.4076 Transcript_3112/m.4076 type:complete len:83 (-) Transcript_3112:187-435(-)